MKPNFKQDMAVLGARGLALPASYTDYIDSERFGHNFSLAMDAQPALTTVNNAGIPAFLTTFFDPEVTRILFAPLMIEEIAGSSQKGSWVSDIDMFGVVEPAGEASGYGDFNNNGMSDANVNFVARQNYRFQTHVKWGELELEKYGEARINYANEQSQAAAWVLANTANTIGFYGVAGLQNYGLLNDPNLNASITPVGGTTWPTKAADLVNGANGIYSDIAKIYGQLVLQTNGLVNRKSELVLALSPEREALLTTTNGFNVNVSDLLAKNFPNLRVVTAPQYNTQAGEVMQLIAPKIQGQNVLGYAYSEKMRAHPVVVGTSNWTQKRSAGAWGTIIRIAAGIATMIGI